jgi:hypothetical protein
MMRSNHGFSIAETAASMTLLIPLIVLILFVILEAGYSLFLKSMLTEAARQGSRNLAISYGQNPQIKDNRGLADALVFEHIRIASVINANAQFEDPVWNNTVQPYTVTVTAKYASGQYGLRQFPYPDVLKLGSKFVMQARSTYRLE